MLGICLRTAQLWTESGLLQGWKTEGGHRRVTRESVERLLAHSKAPDPPRPEAVPAHSEKRRFRVLLVERAPDLVASYRRHLRQWPMAPKVTTVSNGFEALIRIGIERPDLVIGDLDLPGMDGFEMLNSLRDIPELAGMEFVVVTSRLTAEIARIGSLAREVPVLIKPIAFAELERIAVAIAARRGFPRN